MVRLCVLLHLSAKYSEILPIPTLRVQWKWKKMQDVFQIILKYLWKWGYSNHEVDFWHISKLADNHLLAVSEQLSIRTFCCNIVTNDNWNAISWEKFLIFHKKICIQGITSILYIIIKTSNILCYGCHDWMSIHMMRQTETVSCRCNHLMKLIWELSSKARLSFG